MMSSGKMNPAFKFLTYLVLITSSIIVLFPILWMISTSVKTETEVFSIPPKWIPDNITFETFKSIWVDYPFGHYFLNTFFVVILATVVSLIFSTLAGYGASRFNFRGRGFFLTFLLVTQMFPSIMLLIPFYKIMSSLNMIDTLFSLVLTYISFTIPFCSWMMMGYFDSIPKELDQAAEIDGCGKFRTFWQVILPLTTPGIAATAIYSFIIGWNEYMFALVLITSETNKTLPVGIGQLVGQYKILWNDLMTSSIIASIPLIIMFLFMQKHFISSLTAGSVK